MANQLPSMTALLGLLAVAGFQNRDKIAEYLHGATSGSNPGAASGGSHGGGMASPQSTGLGGAQEESGGGLGGLLSGLGGGGQQGGLGGLLGGLGSGAAGGLLANGLSELVQHFRQNGLGSQASSWVSAGPNEPVEPQQLQQAIDPEVLATLSQKTGLDQQEILNRLSQVLPQAVDGMTPGGQLPQGRM